MTFGTGGPEGIDPKYFSTHALACTGLMSPVIARLVEFLLNQSVGRVLDRLTALVANHVPLIREPLAVQLPQQVAHAVAFEPER